jgi:hypothetical protein
VAEAEAELDVDVDVEGAVDADAVEPEDAWENCDEERTLRQSDLTPDVTISPRSTGSSLRVSSAQSSAFRLIHDYTCRGSPSATHVPRIEWTQ